MRGRKNRPGGLDKRRRDGIMKIEVGGASGSASTLVSWLTPGNRHLAEWRFLLFTMIVTVKGPTCNVIRIGLTPFGGRGRTASWERSPPVIMVSWAGIFVNSRRTERASRPVFLVEKSFFPPDAPLLCNFCPTLARSVGQSDERSSWRRKKYHVRASLRRADTQVRPYGGGPVSPCRAVSEIETKRGNELEPNTKLRPPVLGGNRPPPHGGFQRHDGKAG